MVLIQAWISKPSQLYKCECGLLLLSIHFSQYNKEDNIPSLRFIPQGIFEFCRQKKSYGSVGNTSPTSFLAYNSKVAKLALSKLLKIFTCGLMSIKKFYPLRIALWSFTGKFIFTSAVKEYQLSGSVFTICSNIIQAKLKVGFVSAQRKSLWLIIRKVSPKQIIWKHPISYLLCRPGIDMVNLPTSW